MAELMPYLLRSALFCCLAAVCTLPALASVTAVDRFPAVKTSQPPPAIPSANAAIWQTALHATGFFNFTARRPAGLPTTAYFLYDGSNLYAEFDCGQAGVPITAAQRVDHAGVGSDDHVALDIDTSGNGSRTYVFRVNPIGIHDESSSENARYAPSWQSFARVSPSGGYDVLMIVPLAAIRSQAAPVQKWRINFERFVAARNAAYTWAYEPAMPSTTSVEFWPWLTNIRLNAAATRPKPQADAYVLESAGSQRNVFQNGIGKFGPMSPRLVGLDVTYPVTNTLAFVGTLNPDFSNVEEDQTTIQLQEFQKNYQEYRPFFAQGAQYINTIPQIGLVGGNTIFYTPSIGVFDRGLKFEGTSGRNDIGLLNVLGPGINDSAAGYTYASPDGSLALSAEGVIANHDGLRDATSGYGISRINRHSGEQTSIEIATESNTATGTAHDFNISEGLRNQHFTLVSYFRDTGAGFSPLDGYTATNDSRGLGATVGYNGTGSKQSRILSYTGSFILDRELAHDGSVREADINGFFNVQFKNLISVQGFAGPSELQVAPGTTYWYNRRDIQLGYRAGTPEPMSVGYAWGPFNGFFVQQLQSSLARVYGPYGFSLEYDGNIERPAVGASISNTQWLRRVVLTRSFGSASTFGLAFRSINGTGGFAIPGSDLSLLYQRRFANQDLLYVAYGTPAAAQTLHRLIVKYVFHVGGGSGT